LRIAFKNCIPNHTTILKLNLSMKKIFILILTVILWGCAENNPVKKEVDLPPANQSGQQEIIDNYLKNCAWQYNYVTNMKAWEACIDKGLEKDPTIAYLWQQKAMPYYKAQKYDMGKPFLDKAVQYNKRYYLPYRGFMKCIFSKDYQGAITDFKEAIDLYGNHFEMDHTYRFYIGLSYLQLNDFEKAEKTFDEDSREQKEKYGEELHHNFLFYHGISKMEMEKWEEAIELFNQSLYIYPTFSDAMYYKSVCLLRLGKYDEAIALNEKAEIEGKKGNTINEANVIYEKYPYQVRWN